MDREQLLGRPRIRRRLAALSRAPVNFDPAVLATAGPENGWMLTDLTQGLPSEPPGMPVAGGSWEVARRLMRGYEFADPSIVRAYYDPQVPLAERTMLLELRALGLLRLHVGVRVSDVYERTFEAETGPVHAWGWNYRTLQGHVEQGQMDWQVWKWLASGQVEFRVHAVSRTAAISNPAIRLGYRLLRERERRAFLESTKTRMRRFVELALAEDEWSDRIRIESRRLTARRHTGPDHAGDALAETLSGSDKPASGW